MAKKKALKAKKVAKHKSMENENERSYCPI